MSHQGYLVLHAKRQPAQIVYFVLEDGFLRYFASPQCLHQLGELCLSGCKLNVKAQKRIDGFPHSFFVETRKVFVKERSYTLGAPQRLEVSASTNEDRQEWGKALFSWQRYYWRDPQIEDPTSHLMQAKMKKHALEQLISKHYGIDPVVRASTSTSTSSSSCSGTIKTAPASGCFSSSAFVSSASSSSSAFTASTSSSSSGVGSFISSASGSGKQAALSFLKLRKSLHLPFPSSSSASAAKMKQHQHQQHQQQQYQHQRQQPQQHHDPTEMSFSSSCVSQASTTASTRSYGSGHLRNQTTSVAVGSSAAVRATTATIAC